ncbi:glycosyltransferase [Fructilactobacillus cliffordii]|uniref:glycosyltransferase n=1 Tax=Fructilactobacillus cliffordii TaxID=2940299 RepID=UPI00209288E9|nr:glycosyltransferase [Fructilactobacillus cliffordii]USS85854.1 glycosyltransferase [Fructilactobacillus cliffordii]
MKKKIDIICNIEPGGITTVVKHLLTSQSFLQTFNFSLYIFKHSNYTEALKNISQHVKINNATSTSKLKNMQALFNFLVHYDGSALIILGPLQIIVAKLVKLIFRKKYVIISWIQVSQQDPGIKNKFFALKYADYHLAISTGIKKELEQCGVPANRIKVVYNPIEQQAKTISAAEPCKFIYIGRITLDGQKNLRLLLRCFARLHGRWQLDVFGSGKDDAALAELVKQNPKLKDNVTLHGWTEDPFAEIKNANALVLNSNYEGFGMVLAEAMSYGIPCISTDCPVGPSDIIKPGVNGFLYQLGDYATLNSDLQSFVNGNVDFKPQVIKESIDFIYTDEYDKRLLETLKKIV